MKIQAKLDFFKVSNRIIHKAFLFFKTKSANFPRIKEEILPH